VKVAEKLIEMFRDIESAGEQLYYAPVHRMVDLLAETLDRSAS
jgi:hypothetical protein